MKSYYNTKDIKRNFELSICHLAKYEMDDLKNQMMEKDKRSEYEWSEEATDISV